MISAILFDLDDTLLDFHRTEREALRATLLQFEIEPNDDIFARYSAINAGLWELLEEKNRRIGEMSSQLKRYRVTNVEVNDISREVGAMMDNIGAISLTKGITFDVEGTPGDTTLVCVVTPRDSALPVDRETLIRWLRIRTKVENVKLFVEP